MKEELAVVSGTGSGQPKGLIHTAPSSRDDNDSPIREANTFQYVNADSDSPFALSYDGLVDLIYKVNSKYRNGASWAFNSNTARLLMQIKDGQLRPLWVDGLAEGQPARLLGYPISIVESMPDIDVSGGSNSTTPIAFGNFKRAYLWVDRVGLQILPDPYTTLGKVRFWISKRVGGAPLNNDAVKFLRTAA